MLNHSSSIYNNDTRIQSTSKSHNEIEANSPKSSINSDSAFYKMLKWDLKINKYTCYCDQHAFGSEPVNDKTCLPIYHRITPKRHRQRSWSKAPLHTNNSPGQMPRGCWSVVNYSLFPCKIHILNISWYYMLYNIRHRYNCE